jgi:NADH-quinone oxidoreductase subunit G
MIRIAGKLVEVKWEDALAHAANGLQEALSESAGDGHNLVGIAGGRAANEDLFTFRRMVEALDGRVILDDSLAGGDLMQQVGVSRGTNLGDLGPGDAVLVVASDLHEEAPLWWLRIKRAAEKGATLVVANARPTRLDVFATHKIRYPFGKAAHVVLGLLHNVNGQADLASFAEDESLQAASKSLIDASNLIIFYGREGLDYDASEALARACANLLAATKHVGRENNGLIAVWPRNNTQGAWDMGLRPDPDGLQAALKGSAAVYVMAADPAGDNAGLADVLRDNAFMVVQELFLTSTAMLADVVFPAQSFVEREGTFTSGERRVQRFYPAVKPRGESQPDWRIIASLAELLGVEIEAISAAGIMSEISKVIPEYADLTYQALARVETQWPPVGGNDLYYGGTAFKNRAGLGIQLTPGVLPDEPFEIPWTIPVERPQVDGLLLVPVTYLYDGGTTITPSMLLQERSMSLNLMLNPGDADRMGVKDGGQVEFRWNGRTTRLPARVVKDVPEGAALLPRSLGLPVQTPMGIKVKPVG